MRPPVLPAGFGLCAQQGHLQGLAVRAPQSLEWHQNVTVKLTTGISRFASSEQARVRLEAATQQVWL